MTASNVVKGLLEEGPAYRCGIMLLDVVVGVNGTGLGMRRVVDVIGAAGTPLAFTLVRRLLLDTAPAPPLLMLFKTPEVAVPHPCALSLTCDQPRSSGSRGGARGVVGGRHHRPP